MDPFQKIEHAFGDIEKEIEKAKTTGDVFAAISAIEKFFAVFKDHQHHYRQPSGDPYVPDYTCTTDPPVV